MESQKAVMSANAGGISQKLNFLSLIIPKMPPNWTNNNLQMQTFFWLPILSTGSDKQKLPYIFVYRLEK